MAGIPTGHIFRVERERGPVWYAKYRLPDGRQVPKKVGPAWTERSRPANGYFTKRLAEERLARRSTKPGAELFRSWFAVLEASGATRITSTEWLLATGLVARCIGRSTHRQPRSRHPEIRVTSDVAASETYASGLALARAFGSTVREPSWWPEDVEEIRCCMARFSAGHAHCEI
jgi:hypothetical protein